MKRREARELVIKALFAFEIEKSDPFRQLAYIAGDEEMSGFGGGASAPSLSAADDEYVRRLTSGILSRREELDGLIRTYAVDWEPDRLGGAERNILRMSLYEMLYDEKLHPAIAINEAVDLVKKYCSPEAAGFVNGILGKKAAEMLKE
ncbi:MAG: transcription antitermination factor NusB [Clostridiales bacterium]|nr:transcription antitermination factor NusB [Clostridiales bacterium]